MSKFTCLKTNIKIFCTQQNKKKNTSFQYIQIKTWYTTYLVSTIQLQCSSSYNIVMQEN